MTQHSETFIFFKPDAIERGLVNTLLQIIQDHGYTVLKQATVAVDEDTILNHYHEVIERIGGDFAQRILNAYADQSIVAVHLSKEGPDAVTAMRTLIGATDPAKADPQSLRGRFGTDTMEKSNQEGRMLNNLIHASEFPSDVTRELALWFKNSR
jgi:nucleoside-diphosphate kinase